MKTATIDKHVETARRLYALYLRASRWPEPERARVRMAAIIRAAHDAKVWREFTALRDGVASR